MDVYESWSGAEAAGPFERPDRGRVERDGADGAVPGMPLQHVARLLEDHGQVGFWCYDVAADKVVMSPGFARISGLPATARGSRDSLLKGIHPLDRPFQSDLLGLIGLGQSQRREFRFLRPDGTVRWVSCKIDVMVDGEGRPARVIGVVADITERREAQSANEFNLGRQAALAAATDGVNWIVSPTGEPVEIAGWCRLTGLTEADAAGDGWTSAIHPDDRDAVRDAFRASLRDGTLYDMTFRLRLADGGFRRYQTRGAPVRDAAGRIIEWQGMTMPARQPGSDDLRREATLTGSQIRGARGLLDWSLARLAVASGVSVSTIKRMEDGTEGTTRPVKAGAVRQALEVGGVCFREVDGRTWLSL